MRHTYITTLPDESGAFLKASAFIAQAGANITRVSYNKAVDEHMLFLDVEGSEDQLAEISASLEAIGYTANPYGDASVVLLEFILEDVTGAVLPILELIHSFKFNITYINSQEDGSGFQNFKMGILIENPEDIRSFLQRASEMCEVRIAQYDPTEKLLDNTVFYLSFANRISTLLSLKHAEKQKLVVQSNLLMQLLDDRGDSPHKIFAFIDRIAHMLNHYKGEAFNPRIEQIQLKDGALLYSIEPPCGSNTYLIEQNDELLFIDSGFACYREEMLQLLRNLFPHFDTMERTLLITHPDLDHAGLLSLFTKVYTSKEGKQHFLYEAAGEPNYRERNPAHAPYSHISRIVSRYEPPDMESIRTFNEEEPGQTETTSEDKPLKKIDSFTFGTLSLDVYRGNDGHAVGEVVFVDETNKLVFSGDIVVNSKGCTPEQKEFNELAPYLMTSVNMNSQKAREEREYLLEKFSPQEYTYCTGHGSMLRSNS